MNYSTKLVEKIKIRSHEATASAERLDYNGEYRKRLHLNRRRRSAFLPGHLKRMESVVQPAEFGAEEMVMALAERIRKENLDKEWVELIMIARAMGLDREVIRGVLSALPKLENGTLPMEENTST